MKPYILILATLFSVSDLFAMPPLSEGTLSCTKMPNDPTSCELSSAAFIKIQEKKYILSNNDKDKNLYLWPYDTLISGKAFKEKLIPERVIPLQGDSAITKIESITSVDDWLVLSGAYINNHKDTNNKFDSMKIFAFKFDEQLEITTPQIVASFESRLIFEKLIQKYYGGSRPGHISFEAATILPGLDSKNQIMVLGLRQHGVSYKEYKHTIHFFYCPINITNETIEMVGSWKSLVKTKLLPGYGTSDMTYDSKSDTVYVTASFEKKGEPYKSALLKISRKDFLKGKDRFTEIKDVPFKTHKSEGIVSTGESLVVIADDDKESPLLGNGQPRDLKEAPFWVIPVP